MITNARYADATETMIACEINGQYSVILVDKGNRYYNDLVAAKVAVAPYEPPALSADDFSAAIQSHVDQTAKSRGYADGVAFAGYSTSTIPSWALEAQAFIEWRDAVWIHAYTELTKVQGGQRAVPTVAELIVELPAIKWP